MLEKVGSDHKLTCIENRLPVRFGAPHAIMTNAQNPWQLPLDRRYLLIFDLHQNMAWLDRVLAREVGNFDHLILGGDYFDPYDLPPTTVSLDKTVERLNRLIEEHGEQMSILFGNHDFPYYVASRMADPGGIYHPFNDLNTYDCLSAKQVAQSLRPEFWQAARFFVEAHGYLISHAGVAGAFWPEAATPSESLQRLEETCEDARRDANKRRHAILAPGRNRGGSDDALGGIIWQDWEQEFSDDDIPLPQIVGHTKSARGARQKGRSWCLDGAQSCYGLLDANGLDVQSA